MFQVGKEVTQYKNTGPERWTAGAILYDEFNKVVEVHDTKGVARVMIPIQKCGYFAEVIPDDDKIATLSNLPTPM